MKRLILILATILLIAPTAFPQRSGRSGSRSSSSSSSRSASTNGAVHVRGYTKKDGTYVAPHMRSRPDGIFENNWSTKGNVNPYTGQPGTRVTPPSSYGGRSISLPETPNLDGLPTLNTYSSVPATGLPTATPNASRPRVVSSGPPDLSAGSEPCPITQPLRIAVVTRLKANLRDSPNQFASVLQEVSEGNALVLTDERVSGWYKVIDVLTTKEGWIHGNVIKMAFTR
jgi:uncharacterized protein YgiM (DUF1202 family)